LRHLTILLLLLSGCAPISRQEFQTSPAYHGAVVSGAMVVTGAVTQDKGAMVWMYVVLNSFLTLREGVQLATDQGEWTDVASGWVIPIPLLIWALHE